MITGYSNTISVTTLAPSFDPDAQAFFNRVTTAGGTLSATEQTAVNQLVLDMKSYGIWSAMKAIYPMVGATAAACAQNLKSSSFTGTFTSGWTFASTGATPNGTSAYMNTALTPSVSLNTTNFSLSYYSRTNSNASTTVYPTDIGSFSSSSSVITVNLYRPSLSPQNSGGGYRLEVGASVLASSKYYGIVSRTTNSLQKLFINNSLSATDTTLDTGTRPSIPIYLGVANGLPNYADRQCAFAHIGDGLTDTEASNLYTAVQAFQTTLSRQN